jgi:predicted DNA-binding transcriptional regulator YafY
MTMSSTTETALKVLKTLELLSGYRKYSKEEIAERLEVSTRTAERYIATLREFGFVISRKDGLYIVEKHTQKFKDISTLLHFSEEEAQILNRAIHSIDSNTRIKGSLISKLVALYDSDRIAVEFVGKEKTGTIAPLLQAIQEKKCVKIKNYHSSGSGKIRDKLLEPFEFTPNYISIWAYEPASKMNKLYKIDRMQEVLLLEKGWEFRQEHKSDYLDCFRVGGKKKIPVSFRMSLLARNLLIEEYPLSESFVTKIHDDLYAFDGWISKFDGLGRFVLGLPGEIYNIKPAEFQRFLYEKVKMFKKK